MYPVYPLIAVCGAWGLAGIQSLVAAIASKIYLPRKLVRINVTAPLTSQLSGFAAIVAVAVFVLFSCSRTASLIAGLAMLLYIWNVCAVVSLFSNCTGYRAPMDIYSRLPSNAGTVCVGKEWYRFPSSFFLPPQYKMPSPALMPRTTLEFIKSDFAGQLPGKFSHEYGTSASPPHFNDMNKEEFSRYVSPICISTTLFPVLHRLISICLTLFAGANLKLHIHYRSSSQLHVCVGASLRSQARMAGTLISYSTYSIGGYLLAIP
jgi:hypothetical protein